MERFGRYETFLLVELTAVRASVSFLAVLAACAGSNIRAVEKSESWERVLTPNLVSSGHVKLYGTHADGKQRGDLLIGEIFGDGAQDFAFALAEGNG